jgi:hypothetical protein
MKKVVLLAILILAAALAAIASKVILPTEVNIEDFDSILVRMFGFEIVATFYFLMIYVHNAIVTFKFGETANLSNRQIGMRFGICFALIYLLGMQEVVVESSPFSAWGFDFVVYQFFGGIGEAVVALALCMSVSLLMIRKKTGTNMFMSLRDKMSAVLFTAAIFTLVRTIGYESGIIHSNVKDYPFPCYVWTILFGAVFGACFILLRPIFESQNNPVMLSVKAMVLSTGMGWTIFNMFIGLIFSGSMPEILLRCGLDVLAVFSATLIWNKYINKLRRYKMHRNDNKING